MWVYSYLKKFNFKKKKTNLRSPRPRHLQNHATDCTGLSVLAAITEIKIPVAAQALSLQTWQQRHYIGNTRKHLQEQKLAAIERNSKEKRIWEQQDSNAEKHSFLASEAVALENWSLVRELWFPKTVLKSCLNTPWSPQCVKNYTSHVFCHLKGILFFWNQ